MDDLPPPLYKTDTVVKNPTSSVLSISSESKSAPNPKSRAPKRKRFTAKVSNPGFNQAQSIPGLSLRPTRKYYLLHTTISSLFNLVSIVHRSIVRRDVRMGNLFTETLLAYVSSIAVVYRLTRVSIDSGYSFDLVEFLALKQMAEAVILPEAIAKFIESLGQFTHENVTYVPSLEPSANYREILCAKRSAISDDMKSDSPADVFVDTTAFIGYMESTGRSYKSGVKLRKINSGLTGTAEFLAAYRGTVNEAQAYYPSMALEPTAQLGAAFRLRDLDQVREWTGHRDCITYNFVSDTYNQDLLLSQLVIDTLNTK